MSRWIETLDTAITCVFFPISIRFRTNLAAVIFPTLASRLAVLFGDDPRRLNTLSAEECAAEITGYLRRALPDGKRLLLVLDGADEASGWRLGPDLLPSRVPPSTRILVSARSLAGDPDGAKWRQQLGWDRPDQTESLSLGPLSQSEVASAIARKSDTAEVPAKLVIDLHRVSEGDPLLVQLYVMRLWASVDDAAYLDQEELHSIAPGIDAFFERWWQDQEALWEGDRSVHRETMHHLLQVLACALGPLYQKDLLALMSGDTPLTPRALEEGIKPLRRLIVGDGAHQGYVFSHPRLADFFREKARKYGELDAANAMFIRWGESTLDAVKRADIAPADVPHYLIQHFRLHLERVDGCFAHAETLLSLDWLAIWQQIERGSYVGFLADVDAVYAAVRRENEDRVNSGRGGARIALELRCALMRSSILSTAGAVPKAFVFELFRRGIWNVATVSASLSRMPDVSERIALDIEVLRQLPDLEAEGFAANIFNTLALVPDAQERAGHLARLGPYLPAFLLREACDVADGLDPVEGTTALAGLLQNTGADGLGTLTARLGAIMDPALRLSAALNALERGAAPWRTALERVLTDTLTEWQADAGLDEMAEDPDLMVRLAGDLSGQNLGRLLAIATRALEDGHNALHPLAQRLLERDDWFDLPGAQAFVAAGFPIWSNDANLAAAVLLGARPDQWQSLLNQLAGPFCRWSAESRLAFAQAAGQVLQACDCNAFLVQNAPALDCSHEVAFLHTMCAYVSPKRQHDARRAALYLSMRSLLDHANEPAHCDGDIATALAGLHDLFSVQEFAELCTRFVKVTPTSDCFDPNRIRALGTALGRQNRDLACLFLNWLLQKTSTASSFVDEGLAAHFNLDSRAIAWPPSTWPTSRYHIAMRWKVAAFDTLLDVMDAPEAAEFCRQAVADACAGNLESTTICAHLVDRLTQEQRLGIWSAMPQNPALGDWITLEPFARSAPRAEVAHLLAELGSPGHARAAFGTCVMLASLVNPATQNGVCVGVALTVIDELNDLPPGEEAGARIEDGLWAVLPTLPTEAVLPILGRLLKRAEDQAHVRAATSALELLLSLAPRLPSHSLKTAVRIGLKQNNRSLKHAAAMAQVHDAKPDDLSVLTAMDFIVMEGDDPRLSLHDGDASAYAMDLVDLIKKLPVTVYKRAASILASARTQLFHETMERCPSPTAAQLLECMVEASERLDSGLIMALHQVFARADQVPQTLYRATTQAIQKHEFPSHRNRRSVDPDEAMIVRLIRTMLRDATPRDITELLDDLSQAPALLYFQSALAALDLDLPADTRTDICRRALDTAPLVIARPDFIVALGDRVLAHHASDSESVAALAHTVLAMEDDDRRDALLSRFLPHVSDVDLLELVQSISAIHDESQGVMALIAAAEISRHGDEAIVEAERLALAIADPHDRANALITLLTHCAPEVQDRIATEAAQSLRRIAQSDLRARALAALIGQLRDPSDRVLIEICAGLRSIDDEWARAKLVSDLGPHMSLPHLAVCLDILMQSESREAHASGLLALAPFLPNPWITEAFERRLPFSDDDLPVLAHALPSAEAVLGEISRVGVHDFRERAHVLRRVAASFEGADSLRLYAEAIKSVQQITEPWTASAILADLVFEIPASLFDKVLETLSQKHHPASTRPVLFEMAPRLPPELLAQMQEAVQDVDDAHFSKVILARLAHLAPDTHLHDAVDWAQVVDDGEARAIVLARLARRFDQKGLHDKADTAARKAFGALRTVAETGACLRAILWMADALPGSYTADLLDHLSQLQSSDAQGAALAVMIAQMSAQDQATALKQVAAIPSDKARARCLSKIAPRLADDTQALATDIALHIGLCAYRAEAIGALSARFGPSAVDTAAALPAQMYWQAQQVGPSPNVFWDRPRAVILGDIDTGLATIRNPAHRALILATLIPPAATDEDDPAWTQLADAVQTVPSDRHTPKLVLALLAHLWNSPARVQTTLLLLIAKHLDSASGEDAIRALVPHLPLPARLQAFAEISKIDSTERRQRLLIQLAPHFATLWTYPPTHHYCGCSGEVLTTQYGHLPNDYADILDPANAQSLHTIHRDPAERAQMLRFIATGVPEVLRDRVYDLAIRAAMQVRPEVAKADALADVVAEAPLSFAGAVLDAAAQFENADLTAPVLMELAPHLTADQLGTMLDLVDRMAVGTGRARVLQRLGHLLAGTDHGAALAVAASIANPTARALVTLRIAQYLSDRDADRLFDQALHDFASDEDTRQQAGNVARLARLLPVRRRPELVDIFIDMPEDEPKAAGLAALTPRLAPEDRACVLDALSGIADAYARATALCDVGPQLPHTCLPRMLEVIEGFASGAMQAQVLGALVPSLNAAGQRKCLPLVRGIAQNYTRAELAIKILPSLHNPLRETALSIALEASATVGDPHYRAQLLVTLAPTLTSAAEMERLIELVPGIPDEFAQAEVLRAVLNANALEPIPSLAGLILSLPDRVNRGSLQAMLGDILNDKTGAVHKADALTCMMEVPDRYARATAFRDYAERAKSLTQDFVAASLDAARALPGETHLANMLAVLQTHHPEALRAHQGQGAGRSGPDLSPASGSTRPASDMAFAEAGDVSMFVPAQTDPDPYIPDDRTRRLAQAYDRLCLQQSSIELVIDTRQSTPDLVLHHDAPAHEPEVTIAPAPKRLEAQLHTLASAPTPARPARAAADFWHMPELQKPAARVHTDVPRKMMKSGLSAVRNWLGYLESDTDRVQFIAACLDHAHPSQHAAVVALALEGSDLKTLLPVIDRIGPALPDKVLPEHLIQEAQAAQLLNPGVELDRLAPYLPPELVLKLQFYVSGDTDTPISDALWDQIRQAPYTEVFQIWTQRVFKLSGRQRDVFVARLPDLLRLLSDKCSDDDAIEIIKAIRDVRIIWR